MTTYKAIKDWYDNKHSRLGVKAWRPSSCYPYFLDILGAKRGLNGVVKLLDVGCGTGLLLQEAAAREYDTYGIDISERAVRLSKESSPKSTIFMSNMDSYDFINGQMNYVTCIGALEHSLDINAALKSIKNSGQRFAKYLIVVPNSKFVPWLILKPGTDQQEINETLHDIDEWSRIFSDAGFTINGIKKDLTVHLKKKGLYSYFLKLVFNIIPLKYTYQFCFLLSTEPTPCLD